MYGQRVLEIIASQVTDGTALTNSTVAGSIIQLDEKTILPSKYLSIEGMIVEVFLHGRISTLNPTPGTFAFDLRLGGGSAFNSGALAINTAAAKTNIGFTAEFKGTVRKRGATAQLFGQWSLGGEIAAAAASGGGVLVGPAAPTLGTAFDATSQLTVDVFGQWSVANAANSIQVHQYVLKAA